MDKGWGCHPHDLSELEGHNGTVVIFSKFEKGLESKLKTPFFFLAPVLGEMQQSGRCSFCDENVLFFKYFDGL